MIDFDELLSDNHSLSINQINHSSEIIFFAENQMTIDRSKSSLLLKDLDVDRSTTSSIYSASAGFFVEFDRGK